MAAVAGKVKSVTSDVIAIDKNDRVRVLNVDDEVYIGESIKGESQSASVTITAVDGSDISLNGYDTIWLDSSVVSADTSAENSSNSLESSENLAEKHSANDEILSDSNELKVDNAYEHANFDATTIYIEIDNDLNKLS